MVNMRDCQNDSRGKNIYLKTRVKIRVFLIFIIYTCFELLYSNIMDSDVEKSEKS